MNVKKQQFQNPTGESQFVIYAKEDSSVEIQVRKDGETVWLTRHQLAELFDRDVKTIGKHVNNALKEELTGIPVVANFATTDLLDRDDHQSLTKPNGGRGTCVLTYDEARNVIESMQFSTCAIDLFYNPNGVTSYSPGLRVFTLPRESVK